MSVLSTLGFGRLPDDAKLFGTPDKFIVKLECVWASITFHDFSNGAGYSAWRRKWFVGSLAITQERLLAYRGSSRLINIPFSDGRFAGLDFSGSDARTVEFVHDASLFQPNWSGKLRYRFRSADAGFIVTEILSRYRQARTS